MRRISRCSPLQMDYWGIEYFDFNLWPIRPIRCTPAAILALEKIRESVNLCSHVVSSVFLCTSHLEYLTKAYNSIFFKISTFFFFVNVLILPIIKHQNIYILPQVPRESWNFYGICNNKHFAIFSSHVVVDTFIYYYYKES